jgi:anaerobic selenocysteine-containing dehydrogenase
VKISGDENDPRSRGYLCPKAWALKGVHEDPERIRRPLRRGAGGWEEIGWEEAFDWAGARLRAIRESHGKDAVATYIGNPTGHDFGAMLYTALFIQALGTERVFTGATVDQFPKNMSCRLMYGDSWLFPIPDIDRTDFFVVIGANPLVSNGSLMSAPDMRSRLRAHRERGGTLVVVDPRRTETAAVADRHLAIRPGADAFLLFALIQVLFAEDRVAPGRLADFTDGIDVVRELSGHFPPEAVEAATGIAAAEIRRLARDFSAAERAVLYGRFGTCTQEFGTLTSWLVDVVNILTGNFDRPGGLMFPRAATGQTEPVAEDSGPVPHARFRSRVRGFPEFDGQLPAACMAEEIDSAGDERVRAMITVAGNPVLSTPNGARLGRALTQLDFMVSVDIYMNETTRFADLILPTTTQLEHENYDFLFQTTSVRNMARHSPRVFEPPAGARHHWQVLLEIAARANGVTAETLDEGMLAGVLATFVGRPGSPAEKVTAEEARRSIGDRRGPERLLDLMLRAGPYGDGFQDGADGLSLDAVREVSHAIDLGPLEPRLPELLRTPGRRLQLAHALLVGDVARLRRRLREAERGDRLLLIGRRQTRNMNSWLHNLEALARGRNRCTLLIHRDDARRLGIEAGGRVRVRSRVGEITVEACVGEEMRPGVVSLPHGFGHDAPGTRLSVAGRRQPGANANQLADELAVDALSGTSILSGISVDVEPA